MILQTRYNALQKRNRWESEHQTKSRKQIMTNKLKWNKQQDFLTHKQAPWTILSALFSQVDQQPVWIGTNVKLHPLYWAIVALFDVVHNLYVQIRSQTRHRSDIKKILSDLRSDIKKISDLRSDIKKISDLWLTQVWYLTDNAWLGVHYLVKSTNNQCESAM